MKIIHHPHDEFAKACLQYIPIAKKLVEAYFPEEVSDGLNLEQLSLKSTEFLHQDISGRLFVDVLYAIPYKDKQGEMQIVVEHLSSREKTLPQRLMRYLGEVINRCQLQEKQQHPYCRALVIYNGRPELNLPKVFLERPYQAVVEPNHQFEDGTVKLIDLTRSEDEKLSKYWLLAPLFLTLKHIRISDLAAYLKMAEKYLTGNKSKHFKEDKVLEFYRHAVVKYLISQYGQGEDSLVKITNLFLIEEKTMKTFAEQYIEQGYNQGITQGVSLGAEKSKLKIATKMLAMGCEPSVIQEATNISPEQLNTMVQPHQTESVTEKLTPR
jgi:predicted transposase/invertase (TIGR01784 family)